MAFNENGCSGCHIIGKVSSGPDLVGVLTRHRNAKKWVAEFIKEHENEVYTMMDTLFNQERVTEIHEKNLMWESYNNGVDDGENKLGALFRALEEAGRKDDAFKAASDAEYRQKLYTEFGIE